MTKPTADSRSLARHKARIEKAGREMDRQEERRPLPEEARAEVTRVFTKGIADLQPYVNDEDYILCWMDSGLAVKFVGEGDDEHPVVCNIADASIVVTKEQAAKMPEDAWAHTPIVKNGAGKQASIVTRKKAVEVHIPRLEDAMKSLTSTGE